MGGRPFHRRAFTLVELLVVMAIIGVLLAVLLPAVQAARESSRAAQCKNNLHQIALATDLFHGTHRAYPPARYQPRPGDPPETSCGGSESTWLVRIMPYLEHEAAAGLWDLSQPYASHPEAVRQKTLPAYCCPSRRSVQEAVGAGLPPTTTMTLIPLPCGCAVLVPTTASRVPPGAVGDYGGNHGDLSPGSFGLPTDFYYGGNGTGLIISSRARCASTVPLDWTDRVSQGDVLDGLSHTFLAGEMHVPADKLGQAPDDPHIFSGDSAFNCSRIGGPSVPIMDNVGAVNNGVLAWGSWHPGICHFAMGDGSVRAVRARMSTEILARLSHRKDSLPVPAVF
jgi:prepilin-type N-terminal cleavage/methylation domain-containing protein